MYSPGHLKILDTRWEAAFFFLLLIIFPILPGHAQNKNQEQVKRIQRSIFIFNLAQQVGWPNQDELTSFRIGVLGPDRTLSDLQSMAQKRKIYGKQVEVVDFQSIRGIKNIQLLYVHHKYNYGINQILNIVSKRNILLITEDYNYNTSMINMVNVGDSFEYEVNFNLMQKEGFVTAPSLKEYEIRTSEKWKKLYQSTEKSLTEVQEKSEEQKTIIKDKEQQIESQEVKITTQEREIVTKDEEISERTKKIKNLYTESSIQQKKFEEKVQIEKELEESIQKQMAVIKEQEEKIRVSYEEMQKQQEFLKQQSSQIAEQETVLSTLSSEISTQKKINGLLIGFVILAVLGSFFIYRGYLIKKRFNRDLKEKNRAIHEQSVELGIKNKELEQFAYIASHDLQEPLNTISSFIGLIAEDYESVMDEMGKESLSFITEASERMRNLIDALLEYSRIGQDKEYANVNCKTLLNELEGDLQALIERSGAIINKRNLPVVKGTQVELRLLFQNLISNGIKFVNPDTVPKIDISCTKTRKIMEDGNHNYWEFSVKDNGIGIKEDQKDRIFAIFQRLHSREKFKGTGIGLAHCKKIVESHGGEIWLESKEGSGTTFYFTIPCTRKLQTAS